MQRFTRRRGQIVLWSLYAGTLTGATLASLHCARRNSCVQPLNALVGGVVGSAVGVVVGFGLAALYRDPSDPQLLREEAMRLR